MAFATDVLNQLVGRVVVRTEWGPDVVIDDPFSAQPTGGTPAAPYLRPEIAIYPRAGGAISADPIRFAPYGSPGETKWPFIVAGGGLLLGWFIFRAFVR